MTTKEAGAYRFTFGSYDGLTIEEISRTDPGLRYLDWMRGQAWFKGPKYKYVREAVETFLDSPGVAKELQELIGDNDS
jgi:hypothetical protein